MQPIGEYVKLDLDVDMEGLSDSDGRSFEFRGRNSLRRVDCNNPNLINRGTLINKVFLELNLESN
jgi:hypothetical protein